MVTRRNFLAVAIAAATGVGATARTKKAAPQRPKPTPTPTAPPTPLARELARALQRDFPAAKLSDATTEKIAADIQSNFDIAKAFRKRRLRNSDEPDFVFSADGAHEP